jgi:hypothetical protein
VIGTGKPHSGSNEPILESVFRKPVQIWQTDGEMLESLIKEITGETVVQEHSDTRGNAAEGKSHRIPWTGAPAAISAHCGKTRQRRLAKTYGKSETKSGTSAAFPTEAMGVHALLRQR